VGLHLPSEEKRVSEKNAEHLSHDWWNGIGLVAALAAFLAIAVVLLANGRGSGAGAPNGRAAGLKRSTVALLRGIPQRDNMLGSSAAPVRLQFFGDLQCPTSRAFVLEMLPSLIARWVRKGKLRIEYRSLKTATPNAEVFMTQQAAAIAAGMQSKLWDYIEYFYREQGPEGSGYATQGFLEKLAKQIPGLDVQQWNEDRQETSLAAEVAVDVQAAARLGLDETPSLLVGAGRRGRPRFTLVEPVALESAIARLFKGEPRRSSASAEKGSAPTHRVEVAYRTSDSSVPGRGRTSC
jgi:protein-disulfide isomerase